MNDLDPVMQHGASGTRPDRSRRAHFVDGRSIKQISRECDLARNTVRRVSRSGQIAFSYQREVQPRPKLGAWSEELERRLDVNDRLSSRERLDLVRIYEDLCDHSIRGLLRKALFIGYSRHFKELVHGHTQKECVVSQVEAGQNIERPRRGIDILERIEDILGACGTGESCYIIYLIDSSTALRG